MNQIERDKAIVDSLAKFMNDYEDCFHSLMPPCDIQDYLCGIENNWTEEATEDYNKILAPAPYKVEILRKYKDRIVFYKTNHNPAEEGFATFMIQINKAFHCVFCVYWDTNVDEEPVEYIRSHVFFKDVKEYNQFFLDNRSLETYIEYEKSQGMGFN